MFQNRYKGKRVLVTGHTGFKGSWLCEWLLGLGAEVAGFSDGVPTEPAHFHTLNLSGRIRDLRGDICDPAAVLAAVGGFRPHVVFHLAAQALVRASYEDPARTFEVNSLGTLTVLEAVRGCPGVEAVICITSDKAYRNDEWVYGYRETDHLGGDDPYSASKACAEIVARSYFLSYFKNNGPRFATVRAGNVIGGGDWATDRIVPDCARAWAAGNPVQIRSPHATRPWQLVLEPLSGYLWLGSCLLAGQDTPIPLNGEAFNFGPAADVNNTVGEVVDSLMAHWPGFTSEMDKTAQKGLKECTLLKLCCDKSLAALSWQATLSFDETLRFTAEWYRQYYSRPQDSTPDMREFSAAQIAAYQDKAIQRGMIWTK